MANEELLNEEEISILSLTDERDADAASRDDRTVIVARILARAIRRTASVTGG